MRRARGVSLAAMAEAMQVSSAYLSALEHGHRGRPSAGLVHQINEFFGLIWDEADELSRLAGISHPKVSIDTAGLSPEATELANRLAARMRDLPPERLEQILRLLDD